MSAAPPADAPAPGGERRYLTLVFSDLSGSTELGAALEAEHYADLLGALRRVYEDTVGRHGGTIVRIQGDGMLAMFGHPVSGEDDGRRATRAVIELHRRVRELAAPAVVLPPGWALALHSGIHAGLVLIDAGDLVRGRFELLGNAPNVAARLSALAQRDEILVTEETLGRWLGDFETGERRLLELRGKSEALAVFAVLGAAADDTGAALRARRSAGRFVGRLPELAQLEATLEAAITAREVRHVAIVSPPGVGKTRLAEEILLRAADRDCRVMRGYCESAGAEPLQPFLQMIRAACGIRRETPAATAIEAVDRSLAAHGEALAAHRGELLGLLSLSGDAPARGAAERRLAALRAWFDAMAAPGPLLLFVDDWHWADVATQQVLSALKGLAGRSVFLLVTTRGFDAGDADLQHATVLPLAPLDDREASQTIAGLLPTGDPFVAAEIRRYAGGNPLFIEELCHSVANGGTDRHPGRSLSGAAWLAMLIESRVARLPRAQAEVLRTAAVIGTVIPAWLLQRLSGSGAGAPALQALADADFLFPGELPGTLRFKHGVTRDVIYDAVGLRSRRDLHQRIAVSLRDAALEGTTEEPLDALAYHFGAAGDDVEAAVYAERAGDRAVQSYALDRAQAHYIAALDALERVGGGTETYRRWMAILQRFALAAVFDPSEESVALLRRGAERALAHRDDAAIAHTAYWLGYLTFAVGDSRGTIEHCERALEAARRVGDEPLAVQIRAMLGQALAAASRYPRALGLLEEAISIKRQHRVRGRPAVGSAFSLATYGAALADLGRFDDALAAIDEALEAVQGSDHWVEGSIGCWKAGVLLWRGRWQQAADAAREAQRVGDRVKSLYVFAMGRSLGAYAEWKDTAGALPLQRLLESTGWLVVRGKRLYLSLNHGWLADALVDVGRVAEARSHAALALSRARRHDQLGAAMACRAIARAQSERGDAAGARRHLELAQRAAERRESPHERAATWLTAAAIAAHEGRRQHARELCERALETFERLDMRWHRDQAIGLRERL